MKRILIFLFILMLTGLACGQVATPTSISITPSPAATTNPANLWFVTRGEAKSDQAWGADTDSQGNIYTAGLYQSPPARTFFDIVVYKFSPDGTEMWRTQWGGKFQEKAFIVTVKEPYIYVGGEINHSISLTDSSMVILALDMKDGRLVWDSSWGSGFGYHELDGLVVDGNFVYASGWTTGEKTGGDIAILKLNRADGSLVWAKTWGTDKFDSADGQMIVDKDSIYISGRINGANMLVGGEAVIVKFSKESGEHLDHKTWGGTRFGDGLGMASDKTYLYVVGFTLDFGNASQIFLLKYDKDLNLLWHQLWGGPGAEAARAAEVDESGNILIAANTDSYGNGGGDLALLEFSPDGKLIYAQTWGGPLQESTHGLALDGKFAYLAGSTQSFDAVQNHSLLIKADATTGLFPQP